MFELKPLSPQAIPLLLKSEHYRLLTTRSRREHLSRYSPVDPENQELGQYRAGDERPVREGLRVGDSRIQDYLSKISDEYDAVLHRDRYERRAKAT